MENQNENIRTIEINGIKLEVDLRTAKRIDRFKVGDNVWVLKKNGGNSFSVVAGVIIDLEVDLRTAKRIDRFKVGDNVKVLKKNGGNSFSVDSGVIIDFVNFKELPTIQIATFESDYFGSKIDFLNFNSKTEDIEICAVSEHELVLEKNRVIDKLNAEIEKEKNKIDELETKKRYFLEHFGKYFKDENV